MEIYPLINFHAVGAEVDCWSINNRVLMVQELMF